MPTSLARATSASMRARASWGRPVRASASTSQKEQLTKAPSPPDSPSSPLYRRRKGPCPRPRAIASTVLAHRVDEALPYPDSRPRRTLASSSSLSEDRAYDSTDEE